MQAKKKLLPANISIEELKCEVPMQDLLIQMTHRLFEIFEQLKHERVTYVISLKYGFDGTSASAYKQKQININTRSEEYIFCSTMVPLELRNKKTSEVIWINEKPNSRLFCLPIRLQFVKETQEVTIFEDQDLKAQISKLSCVSVGQCRVEFDFSMTMLDGKASI